VAWVNVWLASKKWLTECCKELRDGYLRAKSAWIAGSGKDLRDVWLLAKS
jgi:hypothetical protein